MEYMEYFQILVSWHFKFYDNNWITLSCQRISLFLIFLKILENFQNQRHLRAIGDIYSSCLRYFISAYFLQFSLLFFFKNCIRENSTRALCLRLYRKLSREIFQNFGFLKMLEIFKQNFPEFNWNFFNWLPIRNRLTLLGISANEPLEELSWWIKLYGI